MTRLLILGGTREASDLARVVADAGIDAVLSYAGRVARPAAQPVPVRVGGFGGAAGLAQYLCAEGITRLIDATHPFAAQMSYNAVNAAAAADVPLAALSRPEWTPQPGDRWRHVPDIAGAVDALARPSRRVMLAVGRMHLDAFAAQPQHRYLLRLVDPPKTPPPLPAQTVTVSRGPFTVAGDTALMQKHAIDTVVAKNAGGDGARAKLDAARALGIEVIMIDRPALPERQEVNTVGAALRWLGHAGADLGV